MTDQAWLAVLTPVAGGDSHTYLIDTQADSTTRLASLQYHHETVPTLKAQQDNSDVQAENSLNPESGIRRSIESWHHGAGQSYYDRKDSDPYRFRSSKGIDPWTKWGATLLPSVTRIRSSIDMFDLCVCTNRLYIADGAVPTSTTDLSSFTALTGLGGAVGDINQFATDGSTVYAVTSTLAGGVQSASGGGTAFTAFATGARATAVGYAKGRLMAADWITGKIWNIVASGAFPSPLFVAPTITWTGFAEGSHSIYVAGNGDTGGGFGGVIYRINVKADGTGLDGPIPASPGMPRGEYFVGKGVYNYLGFVFLATNKGIRFCTQDSVGDLNVGSPIPIAPYGATAAFGDDRFVYFGWPGYDSSSGGLGRMDLSVLTDADALSFAYASDLMAPLVDSYTVPAIAKLGNRIVFIAESLTATGGLYAQDADSFVSTGTLDSGGISMNLGDLKTANKINVRYNRNSSATTGSIATWTSADNAAFVSQQTQNIADAPAPKIISAGPAETVELRAVLTGDADDEVLTTLTRQTIQFEAVVDTGNIIMLPLILAEETDDLAGSYESLNVDAELTWLDTQRRSKTPITLGIGDNSYNVVIRDYIWSPTNPESTGRHNQGTVVLKLKES